MKFIKNLFKKKKTPNCKFINKAGEEIKHKEYLEDENMLVIETETGLEKIPADGLKKVEE